MTCPIAHYADLPGYTQADVEAACKLAHATTAVGAALDAGRHADAELAHYNRVAREVLPDRGDRRYGAIMYLAFKHDRLTQEQPAPHSGNRRSEMHARLDQVIDWTGIAP